jgi:hypothetical protein
MRRIHGYNRRPPTVIASLLMIFSGKRRRFGCWAKRLNRKSCRRRKMRSWTRT